MISKSDDATPNANTAAPAVITVSRIGDERRRGMLPRSLKGMIKRRRLQPCRGIVLTPCGKEQFDTEKRTISIVSHACQNTAPDMSIIALFCIVEVAVLLVPATAHAAPAQLYAPTLKQVQQGPVRNATSRNQTPGACTGARSGGAGRLRRQGRRAKSTQGSAVLRDAASSLMENTVRSTGACMPAVAGNAFLWVKNSTTAQSIARGTSACIAAARPFGGADSGVAGIAVPIRATRIFVARVPCQKAPGHASGTNARIATPR